jgi:hypothetical protein
MTTVFTGRLPYRHDTIEAWARLHLPERFRSCLIGELLERDGHHFSESQTVINVLRRRGLIVMVGGTDASTIPHGDRCRGKVGGTGWRWTVPNDAIDADADALDARILMRLDEPREDNRIERLREAADA